MIKGDTERVVLGAKQQGINGSLSLVTGGAGFIGSELVRQLAAHDTSVIVVDNLVNGKRENFEE